MAVNHYSVLGLCSNEEGWKLSQQQITQAYRSKAKEIHPDKSHDPCAHANFVKLQASYQILKDRNKRKFFDDDLQRRHEQNKSKLLRDGDSRRRRMKSDLEERENSAARHDGIRRREDATSQTLKAEVESVIAAERARKENERGKNSNVLVEDEKFNEYNYSARMGSNNIGGGCGGFEDSQAYEAYVLAKLLSRQTQN